MEFQILRTVPHSHRSAPAEPCTLHAFSLRTVLSHARSPSPQPSPQGEGEPFASATKDRNAANGSEQDDDSPSPWGEGWGEGERIEQGCRVLEQSLHLRLSNPKGIASSSPGLRGTSYPGISGGKISFNLE